jgi:hypothetical protein
MPLPSIAPLGDEHLREYCEFLHQNMAQPHAVEVWRQAFLAPWADDKPNNGFIMRNEAGAIVGGIGAIYSTQVIHGKPERFCNITSWCVLDEYRAGSMRLALALTSQKGYHYTDLTPTAVVASSLQFLKFKPLDSDRTVLFNLPWPQGETQILSQAEQLASCLAPDDARIYRHHSGFPWLEHLAVGLPGEHSYVIFKKGALKNLPTAEILYLSQPSLFLRHYRALGSYLLLRRGRPMTRVESRFLGAAAPPLLSKTLSGYRSKVYRSDSLAPADISNLYSELACLDL